MAEATVPLNTPASQPTRRGAVGALATAGVAVALGPREDSAAEPVPVADPHVGWYAEYQALHAAMTAPAWGKLDWDAKPAYPRFKAVEDLILGTPPAALPAAAVQAAAVLPYIGEEDVPDDDVNIEVRALRRIRAAGLPAAEPVAVRLPVDPHPEWKRRRLELRELINGGDSDGPDSDVLFDEACRLEDLIADTPARSFAGIATQVWLAANAVEEGLTLHDGACQHRALRNALAALAQLAGPGGRA